MEYLRGKEANGKEKGKYKSRNFMLHTCFSWQCYSQLKVFKVFFFFFEKHKTPKAFHWNVSLKQIFDQRHFFAARRKQSKRNRKILIVTNWGENVNRDKKIPIVTAARKKLFRIVTQCTLKIVHQMGWITNLNNIFMFSEWETNSVFRHGFNSLLLWLSQNFWHLHGNVRVET